MESGSERASIVEDVIQITPIHAWKNTHHYCSPNNACNAVEVPPRQRTNHKLEISLKFYFLSFLRPATPPANRPRLLRLDLGLWPCTGPGGAG